MSEKEPYEPYKISLSTLIILSTICFSLIAIIITSLYIYDYNKKELRYNEAVQSDYIDVLEYNMNEELDFENANTVKPKEMPIIDSEYLKLKPENFVN